MMEKAEKASTFSQWMEVTMFLSNVGRSLGWSLEALNSEMASHKQHSIRALMEVFVFFRTVSGSLQHLSRRNGKL